MSSSGIMEWFNKEQRISKPAKLYYCAEFGSWYEELPSASIFAKYIRRLRK